MSLLKWEKGGLKSPLARARGLGSAKDGVEHWIAQRVTSVANIPLTLWLLFSLFDGVGTDYETFVAWLSLPWNAVLMILLVISSFYHAYLGAQVVIEDYVHNEAFKIIKLLGQKFYFLAAGITCIFCVLKIAL